MGEQPAATMNDNRVPHPEESVPRAGPGEARRLAVLVDAENVSPTLAPLILAEAMKHGRVEIRRAFGALAASGWGKVLVGHAFHTGTGTSQAGGRNAADIELTIAAMDLLHDTRIDGYYLVSGDSDFAPLAIRLRQSGRHVVGIGGSNASRAFVEACDAFVFLDPASAPPNSETADSRESERQDGLIELLAEAMPPLADADGWVDISVLGARLRKFRPGFTPSQYGKKKLKGLLQSCDAQVEIRTTASTSLVRMRRRDGQVHRHPATT